MSDGWSAAERNQGKLEVLRKREGESSHVVVRVQQERRRRVDKRARVARRVADAPRMTVASAVRRHSGRDVCDLLLVDDGCEVARDDGSAAEDARGARGPARRFEHGNEDREAAARLLCRRLVRHVEEVDRERDGRAAGRERGHELSDRVRRRAALKGVEELVCASFRCQKN